MARAGNRAPFAVFFHDLSTRQKNKAVLKTGKKEVFLIPKTANFRNEIA